jgi:hypothetical protein
MSDNETDFAARADEQAADEQAADEQAADERAADEQAQAAALTGEQVLRDGRPAG